MIEHLTILVLILAAAVVLLLYAVVAIFRAFVGKEAPFIRSPWMAVNILENFLSLDEHSVFYDLGCGDGRVMRAFFERYPKARFIGIEKNFFPYIAFILRNGKINNDRFSVERADIFKTDLSDATHIFTYLLPPMMEPLEKKLRGELKSGTEVVSLDFPFSLRKPKETVKYFDKYRQERFIYIYEF